MAKQRIVKGDTVRVITGEDRGKTGKVLHVLSKGDLVVVEGVRIAKRHQRARQRNQKGQIGDKAMPVHISNVERVGAKA